MAKTSQKSRVLEVPHGFSVGAHQMEKAWRFLRTREVLLVYATALSISVGENLGTPAHYYILVII